MSGEALDKRNASNGLEAPSSPLEYALAYAAVGFAVFPCKPRGKEPITKHGFKDATRDGNQIRRWWTRRPNANVGIATGAPSELVVVDIDSIEGAELLVGLTKRFGVLTPTHSVVTGKGRHYYFKLPPGCGATPSSAEGGLDIRADGGYVVAPPSIHPDGGVYRWDASSPNEMALAPQWLLDFARNRKAVGGAARGEESPRSNDGSADREGRLCGLPQPRDWLSGRFDGRAGEHLRPRGMD